MEAKIKGTFNTQIKNWDKEVRFNNELFITNRICQKIVKDLVISIVNEDNINN